MPPSLSHYSPPPAADGPAACAASSGETRAAKPAPATTLPIFPKKLLRANENRTLLPPRLSYSANGRLRSGPGRMKRLGFHLPGLLVEIQHAPFPIRLNGHLNQHQRARGGLRIESGLLAAAHAIEEVSDVSRHPVVLVVGPVDWNPGFLRPELRPVSVVDDASRRLGAPNDVIDAGPELAMIDHNHRAQMAPDQARNVLRVRHRGAEDHRVAFRILGQEVERVGHFAGYIFFWFE